MTDEMDLTRWLRAAAAGDEEAAELAYGALYDQLQRLARSQLRRHGRSTLETSDLVHEAYVKIARGQGSELADRSHFLRLAARAMRQILVDHARHKRRLKRGGGAVATTLGEGDAVSMVHLDRVLAVDQALERLARDDERLVSVVECKYFAGYTEPETAEALGVSERTVRRLWTDARARLHAELAG